jgi:N-methylhydantoinase A
VSLQGREYERTNTAVVNAYLIPVLGGYLRELEQILPRLGISAPLWVMQSSGGLASAEQAATMPVRTLESGPAAGVLASAHFGAVCGHSDVLSLDMGGTTAKVAIVEGGVPSKATSFELHRTQNRHGSGLPVDIAAIDLVEIGTGGGSVAKRRFGVLQVGPQSAGAQPGPACYARGGEKVTVTDANLLLGYLNPEQFAGGTMTLNVDAANIVMDALAKEINLDRIRTAWGVHEVANLEMESALRLVSIERGFDPRDFVLVCIGGAAGTHGSRLGRALGIRKMIVPPGAGVGSAVGLLEGRESVEFAQSTQIRLDDDDAGKRATVLLKALEISARESIGESWSNEVLSVRRAVGLRYVGQGYELSVPLNETGDIEAEQVKKNFHDRYEKNYGYRETSLAAEAVTWYLTLSRVRTGGVPATGKIITEAELGARTRSIYLGDEGHVDVPIVERQNLSVGTAIEGPCIIEEEYTTTLVLANDIVSVDTSGALVIEIGEE